MTDNDAGRGRRQRFSPALVETAAGLTAGSVATLVVHPLDIVKTRMQIHSGAGPAPAGLTTVALLRALARSERPVASLYRGLAPNLLGNATSWASFFFFKARIERGILSLKPQPHGGDGDDLDHRQGNGGGAAGTAGAPALTPQDYFVASGLAGLCTQALTNPIWVLKTRMLSSDRGAAGAYPSMWAGARELWRSEGLRGFYRGLGISLFGVSHGAVQFAVYDPLKQMYFARRRQRKGSAEEGGGEREGGGEEQQQQPQRMSAEATVVLSSVSKLVAGAATYPYQVIRSRLQNYDADERFGRGIQGVARRTWALEGWRGFYRGLVPGVVRVLPATWVTFLVYENTKFYLAGWEEE